MYKSVAEFNEKTFVQIDYQVHTIYWHIFFDRVLLYVFNKLYLSNELHTHVYDNTNSPFHVKPWNVATWIIKRDVTAGVHSSSILG